MTPKTKIQHEVVRLSKGLPKISPAQTDWAIKNIFNKEAIVCKKRAWCTCCGKTFDYDETSELSLNLIGDDVICPHCGEPLKAISSRKRKVDERWYYTILTTCKGYQVTRNFMARKYIRQGMTPVYELIEVVQNWLHPNGKEEVIARAVNAMSMYYDAWNFSSRLELRNNKHLLYTGGNNKYHIDPAGLYPRKRVLKILRRNGFSGELCGIPVSQLMKMLINDNEAETLYKTGQYALLFWKWKYGMTLNARAHAIRIANRNRYIVKDASMWLDYLDLLTHFGYDTHNAHYVCPTDLKHEHDKLLARKRRQEAAKRAEERRLEAAKWEEEYKRSKGAFFGICFGNEHIIISVITSVADMAEEGLVMHHCVYENGYYKKPHSLILTARDADGNRLETIEISLKTFQVVQSRSKCNGTSKYHSEILSLINQNINLIKAKAA